MFDFGVNIIVLHYVKFKSSIVLMIKLCVCRWVVFSFSWTVKPHFCVEMVWLCKFSHTYWDSETPL